MARPAHQDIDGLAEALEKRAEIEGLSKGFSMNVRRQFGLWAVRWAIGLAVAITVGATVDWLWWLPLAAAALASVSLAWIFVVKSRIDRKIGLARDRLDTLEETLADLARDQKGHKP